jgi:hypothetical protein
MDPMIVSILTALATGAAAAAKDTASVAIKDAYQGLKTLVQRRLANKPQADMVLAEYQKEPETWTKPMEKALTEAQAGKDDEILRQAQALLELVARERPDIGISVTGSGAAASDHSVAAGKGGIAAGGDVSIGRRDEK